MAAKIVKTEKLLRPACRLTGLRYTEADRKNGSFSHKWAEWFSQGLFAPLEQAPRDPDGFLDGSYVGAMRMADGGFEYWIGMFLPQDAPVPEGYEHMDLPEETCALFWIYGSETGGAGCVRTPGGTLSATTAPASPPPTPRGTSSWTTACPSPPGSRGAPRF